MKQNFQSNVLWRILITMPVKFTGLVTLPLLTNLYTKEEYAAWAQIVVLTAILKFLLCLRFEVTLVRFLKAQPKRLEMIRSVFTLTLLTVALFLLLTLIFKAPLTFLLFKSGSLAPLLLPTALWIGVKALLEAAYAVLKADEKIVEVSLWQLTQAVWQVSSAALAFILRLPIHQLIMVAIVGHLLLLVSLHIRCKYGFPFLNPRRALVYLRKYFHFTWPLNVDMLLIGIIKSADYFLIIHLVSMADLGVYHVTVLLTGFLTVAITPVHYVLFPLISRLWNEGRKDEVGRHFELAFIITLKLGVPILIALVLLYPTILHYVTPDNYAVDTAPVLLVALSTLLMMIYYNNLFVIHLQKKTYRLPLLSMAAAAMIFLFGFILVPWLGLTGAALTRALVALTMSAYVTLLARKMFSFSFQMKRVIKILFSAAAMGVVIFLLPRGNLLWLALNAAAGGMVYFAAMAITGELKEIWGKTNAA